MSADGSNSAPVVRLVLRDELPEQEARTAPRRASKPVVDLAKCPAPLIEAEVDLLRLEWMPFPIRKVLNDPILRDCAPAIWKARVRLMIESWHQVPAGSVPSSPTSLQHLCSIDVRTIAAKMSDIMAGWTLCSDGRYYHPDICQEAEKAWRFRQSNTMRQRRWRGGEEEPCDALRNGADREKDKESLYPERESLVAARDRSTVGEGAAVKKQKWEAQVFQFIRENVASDEFERLYQGYWAGDAWAKREINRWDGIRRSKGRLPGV